MTNPWDAAVYDARFGFVARSGDALLDLLELRPGLGVLDLGCGTGRHAGMLAERGAHVVGLDLDVDMLATARVAHPGVRFVQGDATRFSLADLGAREPFDACLSNAALHWMTPQDLVLANVRGVLADGAPFVAEMGGAGNIARMDSALRAALGGMGLAQVDVVTNFFPTVGAEAALLEAAGFRVEEMAWFERPTPLGPGTSPADWTRQFRAATWDSVPADLHADLAQRIDAHAESSGLHAAEGGWVADYCRLRFRAVAA
jgi:trans-aconitate methyltransferase